ESTRREQGPPARRSASHDAPRRGPEALRFGQSRDVASAGGIRLAVASRRRVSRRLAVVAGRSPDSSAAVVSGDTPETTAFTRKRKLARVECRDSLGEGPSPG